jgi:glutamate racemase
LRCGEKPIAVFDSGLGGLTAVRELRSLRPEEDIVYFGDTGRVPYGTRSRETIRRFTAQAVKFLLSFQPKALLIACGTASAVALEGLECGGIPAVGVVEPSVRKAASVTKNGRVGLIATPSSVRTHAYKTCAERVMPGVALTERDGRLLVPVVEAGRIGPGDPVTALLVEEYAAPFRAAGVDTLILGCTHYPLLTGYFQEALPGVTLISAGSEGAVALGSLLPPSGSGTGIARFFVSDDAEGFASQASLFLSGETRLTAKHVDLDTGEW